MILSDKDPFSSKAWQEFLNQLAFLAEHNINVSDVEKALKEAKLESETEKTVLIQMPKCPECGQFMQVYPVNTDPKKRDRVLSEDGKEYKSMWLCGTSCSGKGCLYEKFSTKTVEEELEELSNDKEQI